MIDRNKGYHCGWKLVETNKGYTFINPDKKQMPYYFWTASNFSEETGVAQVEFMRGGSGCVTADMRILDFPFDGKLIDSIDADRGVYEIKVPHKRHTFKVYSPKTKKYGDTFQSWTVQKVLPEGGRLVQISPKNCIFVNSKGEITWGIRKWMETSLGIMVSINDGYWYILNDDAKSRRDTYTFLLHSEDENGIYFKSAGRDFLVRKDGTVQYLDEKLKFELREKPQPTSAKYDKYVQSGKIHAYKTKSTDKYFQVFVDTDDKRYALEELGESLKVSYAYKGAGSSQIFLYGHHTGEEMAWWHIDQQGNVEPLKNVMQYGYDKYGSIVSGGKTIIYKAQEIEDKYSKIL